MSRLIKRRLLDKRGRFFEKINLLDLIIIGFFMLLVPGVSYYYLKWHYFVAPQTTKRHERFAYPNIVPVAITVEFRGVYAFVRDLIKPGDELRDKKDMLIGRVRGIISDKDDGEGGARRRLRLQLYVLAEPQPKRRYIFIGEGVNLKAGSGFSLETEKYLVPRGTIVDVEILKGSDSLEVLAGVSQGIESARQSPRK